jgi:general secretion pathway protein H
MSARPTRCAQSRRSGFTLVELLVVLSILGLLVMTASTTLQTALPALALKSAAQILADDLRATRRSALLQGRETSFTLLPGAYAPGEGVRPRALPDGTGIRLAAVRARPGAAPDVIRFFADGSSTGGRVELLLGKRTRAIEIDWLTGRVLVDE